MANVSLCVRAECVFLFFCDGIRLTFSIWWENPDQTLNVNWGTSLDLRVCVITQWCQVKKTGYFLCLCQHSTHGGERKEGRKRVKENGRLKTRSHIVTWKNHNAARYQIYNKLHLVILIIEFYITIIVQRWVKLLCENVEKKSHFSAEN